MQRESFKARTEIKGRISRIFSELFVNDAAERQLIDEAHSQDVKS